LARRRFIRVALGKLVVMHYHALSWPAVAAMDKARLPVVIPLGSLEQHGHHLPLFTDTLQVEAIAAAADERLGDRVLLLPTLWLGCSDHHKDFPGAVSVSGELYARMIQSVARSLLRAGFTKQLFLNGHGGNFVPVSQALGDLTAEDDAADAAFIVLGNWWGIGRDAMTAERVGAKQPGVNHACEYETSLMLHLFPRMVDAAKAVDRPPVLDSAWTRSGKVTWFSRFHRRTSLGATGFPTAATADKGRLIFDGAVGELVAFLEEFAGWEPKPAIGPR
jgi:creatinine amidohydrolase